MSPYYLLFEGHSGQLLEAREQVGAAAETRGVLYGLHLGRFSDLVTRWLYFIVSLAGTAMVGTGLVLWTVKRRQKLQASGKPEHFGLWLVDRLNIGSIAGLSLAITGFLWANRLLPLATPDRAAAEIQVFFIVWGAAFVHALLRPSRAAWREQWLLAALALALLPFLNAWTTDRSFVRSLATGDGLFLMADILFLMFAALHAVLAWRCWRPKSKSVRVAPVRSAKVEEVRP